MQTSKLTIHQAIASLPPSDEIRAELSRVTREANLLRKMLRAATQAEKNKRDAEDKAQEARA